VHKTRDGVNIGTLTASEKELTTIVGALRATGKGVVQLISDAYMSPSDEFAEVELALIRTLAEAAGRPLSFTLQQADAAPERWRRLMQGADEMTADGFPVRGQVSPRPIGVLLGLDATVSPFLGSATYRSLLARPLPERVAELRRPDAAEAVVAEATAAALGFGFERLFRMGDPVDYEPAAASSIGAESTRLGVDPVAHCLEVMLEDDGRRLLYAPFVNYSYGNLDHVREMLLAPNALYGLSDGGAHCGTICDASYPTTTLTLWARDRRRGELIPIEHLVRGYTRRNAEHVGWFDRGLVAPGFLADLNVIDFDVLDVPPPTMIHDLPAGGKRLIQPARGYRYTVKSGAVTFEDGEHTGALPGTLLRGAQTR
jgi:N-acyl-D-aspartate/D-glutamate deacylase